MFPCPSDSHRAALPDTWPNSAKKTISPSLRTAGDDEVSTMMAGGEAVVAGGGEVAVGADGEAAVMVGSLVSVARSVSVG